MLSERDDLKYYNGILEQRFHVRVLIQIDPKDPNSISKALDKFYDEEMKNLNSLMKAWNSKVKGGITMEAYGERCANLGAVIKEKEIELMEKARGEHKNATFESLEKMFEKRDKDGKNGEDDMDRA